MYILLDCIHEQYVAEELAEAIGEIQTTFLVSVKGHAAVFYTPGTTIPMRTTGKENNWVKREKPERDNSGQIIR